MKKSLCRRALALLAAIAVFSGVSASALSRSELLSSQSTVLAKDAVLYSNTMWSETYGDYLHENYIDYFPNTSVVPAVEYGSKLCNYGSFSSMASLLEDEGYTVIAGINGDYYDTSSFCPLGLVIKDGRLISSDAGLNAVGFRADGSVFISRPALKLYLEVDGLNYRLQAINKVRDGAGMWLYTDDFSQTTKSSGAGYDVVLTAEEPLKIGFEGELTVESVSPASGASSIPEGKLLLTVLASDEYFSSVASSLEKGRKLHLSIQSDDERWYEAENAVGSLYKLITGGGIESGLDNTLNPRTAIGVREDGSMVLYTVDGRRSGYSVGASMRQTAQRLLELGCTEAGLLDGGGSTGMNALYIGSEDYSAVNTASGASQRSVTNYVMLVSKDNSSAGAASQLGVYPTESLILAGGQMTFASGAADSSGKKAALPADAVLETHGGIGEITPSGAFTAGSSAAFGSVTLSSGSLAPASAFVTVISSPDSISVTRRGASVSSLTLSPGEKIDLDASAKYNRLPVISQDECYEWSVTGNIGSINSAGVFTAGEENATGSITVRAGGRTVSIPTRVAGSASLVADFEDSFEPFTANGAELSLEKDSLLVRFGLSSLRVDYTPGAVVDSGTDISLPYVDFWLCGDGSASTVMICGSTLKLNFTGWKHFTLPVSGTQRLTFAVSGSVSGSFMIDQIVASPASAPDTVPPAITLSASGGALSGKITDSGLAELDSSRISVTLDGVALPFTFSGSALSAVLPPEDGLTHQVSVTATDIFGNISRKALTLSGTLDPQPFADMEEHWAKRFTSYLCSLGYIAGNDSSTDLLFRPDEPMTREDFSVIIASWLALDLDKYADTALPFADNSAISAAALPAVKAVYSLGILKGLDNDGVLYFEPAGALTRAQAMTIIGRCQPRGFAENLSVFSDSASVPDWAAQYVASLVSQGVVNGFEDGTVRPKGTVTRAEAAKMIAAII